MEVVRVNNLHLLKILKFYFFEKKAEAWRKSDQFVHETVETLKRNAAQKNLTNDLAELEKFVSVKQK